MATESIQSTSRGFRSSSLKRPAALMLGDNRLLVDGDGSVCSLESLSGARALFGRSQVYFYKVQAGVVVPAQRAGWSVELTPGSVALSGVLFDCVEVAQRLYLTPGASGFVRRASARNLGNSRIVLRLVSVSDPTSAHFKGSSYQWGSFGMEAFNRGSHIAMDETSDPRQARAIGAAPPPTKFYMTTDRAKAAELVREGDLPEKTAGMSGHVLVLSVHELELAPSESKEVLYASIHSPNKTEGAVSSFESLKQAGEPPSAVKPSIACSSPGVSEAFGWAVAAVAGAPLDADPLDRLEAMPGLDRVDPRAVDSMIRGSKALVGKGGLIPHSRDPTKPGVLETSLLVSAACRHLVVSGDRKAARRPYALLRKAAQALLALSRDGALRLDPGSAQGWRRHVRTGYPAGEVPEVSLAASAALRDIGLVSQLLGKGGDAAAFAERSELIAEGVARRLRDPDGFLCSEVDSAGRPSRCETVDMGVACFRNCSLRSAASSAVHRLLEDDFQTQYGPRTVPTSDRACFHGTYGQGQLGGYWTRAALAMSCLSYAVELPGVGSLLLEKVSKLVTEDALKLGGVPGEFPYWVDIEGSEVHGERSDPVSASRFIQAVVEGELGFEVRRGVPAFDPPVLSTVTWVLAKDIQVGAPASIFVGRAAGKVTAFASCRRGELKAGEMFESCEELKPTPQGTHGISFHGPGQVVCVGNSSSAPVRAHIAFAGRAAGFARRLTSPLEEYDPEGGGWSKIGSIRVAPLMSFDAPLGPGEWRAYRVSND
ncbi:MAG TPA: hypothetical protein VEC02_00660 [Nitrososphaerales archaeon]|nr:hypothetical protein [Nitrososphaerales archaeon]